MASANPEWLSSLPNSCVQSQKKLAEDFFDGDSFSNYLDLFMMATPSFPFKRTRNFIHSCLFLFSLETVSTVWNRGLRYPSTTSRQSSFCDVSFRCAIRSVSVCSQGSPKLGSPVSTIGCECLMSKLSYSAHQINLVKGPCSVQLEAMLLCRGLRSPHLDQLFSGQTDNLSNFSSLSSLNTTSSVSSILEEYPGPSFKIFSSQSVRNKIAL